MQHKTTLLLHFNKRFYHDPAGTAIAAIAYAAQYGRVAFVNGER